MKKFSGLLLLEDGTTWDAEGFGHHGFGVGELCFNTSMSGYQEIFTDPSYYGQLMLTTNPHIGNYGVNNDEIESESIKISGLICKDFNRNDLISVIEDDDSITLSGTLYVNVVSPYSMGSDSGIYRSYPLIQQDFSISINKQIIDYLIPFLNNFTNYQLDNFSKYLEENPHRYLSALFKDKKVVTIIHNL